MAVHVLAMVAGFCILLLASGTGQAQSFDPEPVERPDLALDPTKPLGHLHRSNWTDLDGLPMNSINAIYQDREGYIWIGTQNGLARFDGQDFRIYSQSNSPGLASNQIMDIVGDGSGEFYVGAINGGVHRYEDGRFVNYSADDGLASNQVERLHLDSTGAVWVMTTNAGVSRLHGDDVTTYTTQHGLPDNRTFSAVRGPEGHILVGTNDGIARSVPGDSLRFEPDPRYTELRGASIIDLLVDEEGALWVATASQGLYCIDDREVIHLDKEDGLSNQISTLFEDNMGAIWIGTYVAGLGRYYEGELTTFSMSDGLAANRVEAFAQDRENSLWIGMHNGGVTQMRNSKFSALTRDDGLSGNSIMAMSEDPTGAMWVATANSGLNRIEGTDITQFSTEDGLPTDVLNTVIVDHDGTVWTGGRQTGICQMTDGGFECLTEEEGLAHNSIFSLYVDSDNRLWAGTLQGLSVLDDEQIRSYTSEEGLSGDLPTAITEGPDGSMWIGTFTSGINRLRNGSITSYTQEGPLVSNQILALEFDHAGQLWIGTGGGLCRWKAGEITCINADDGLFTSEIIQLNADDAGQLWLGSLGGIARIPLSTLNAVLGGRRDSIGTQKVYGYGDGLPSPETQGGIQPSTWERANGDLWFATAGGVGFIDPSRFPKNRVPPEPQIERVLVEDSGVPVRDNSVFEPGTGKFDFSFSGLTFVNNEGTTFQYKLEGYENSWTTAGGERAAHYTNLGPGSYRFVVRAKNHDEVWSEKTASMAFTIEPFFYQTVWFYLLCAFGLVGGGYGAYKLRVRQIQKREEELSRLVDEQTKELQEREEELEELNESLEEEVERQLEVILEERERAERKRVQLEERKRYEEELIKAKEKAEESAKLKATILMNMSHEIRTPLTSILGFAEVLEEEIEGDHLQFAELIRKSGERLLDTLNSVLDMSQLEANSMSIEATEVDLVEKAEETLEMFEAQAEENDLYLRLETNTDGDPVTAQLDESFIDRILDNLVGNALKFTEEGGVTVRVHDLEDTFRLEIEDTGVGISEEFLPQLFEAFKQESSGLRRSHEGTGLGLAITKRLVELMDGTIEVESEKDEGTTFIIEMPREVGSQEPDHDPLDREEAAEGELAEDGVLEGASPEQNGSDTNGTGKGEPEEDETDEIKLGLDDDELSDLQRGTGSDTERDSDEPDAHPGPHPDVISHEESESRS